MHLNVLPNECLLNVFKYLPLVDIVLGVRLTCTHWYDLSFNGCLWRTLHLDSGGMASRMSDDSFLHLLRCISDSVEEIIFGYSRTISEVGILHDDIYCPHLNSIDLRGIAIGAHGLKMLLTKYPRMEKLFVELTPAENCTQFLEFLIKTKPPCLKSLFIIFELEINFETSYHLDEREVEEAFAQNPTLKYMNALLGKAVIGCTAIERLSITFNHLSDKTLNLILSANKHFTHLSIAYCSRVRGDAFNTMSSDNRLVSLNVDNTRLTNKAIKVIATKCQRLKSISLRNCNQVTDEGVAYLVTNCPLIERFTLNHARFNQNEHDSLIDKPNGHHPHRNIRHLSINLCLRVTDIGITAVATSCHSLRELGLAGCTSITDSAVKEIAMCCPYLTMLNLSGCMYVSDNSVNLVIIKCRFLEMLFLQTCYNVAKITFPSKFCTKPECKFRTSRSDASCEVDYPGTDTNQEEVDNMCTTFESCKREDKSDRSLSLHNKETRIVRVDSDSRCLLQQTPPCLQQIKQDFAFTVLNLDFCNQISDESLCQIASNCPRLQEIWLRGCFRITDYGVGILAEKCSLLSIFDISGGSVCNDMQLTDESLYKLSVYSQCLSHLSIIRNWNFTIKGISAVLSKCKRLHKVSVSSGRHYGVTDISIQNSLEKIWAYVAVKKYRDTDDDSFMILTLYPYNRRTV